uniref:Uncharacterized protein n=1 Tax=Anguilla anguilla TaxID=7936 RepID=A0A0E9RDR4_ANGAN
MGPLLATGRTHTWERPTRTMPSRRVE